MARDANPYLADPTEERPSVSRLSKSDAEQDAEDLRDALERFNHAYYVDNDPLVSDDRYDALFNRLREIEDRFPELESRSSPTQRVGVAPSGDHATVEHVSRMLSLTSVFDREEARSQTRRLLDARAGADPPLVAEPKLDGLSLEVVYRDGTLVRAVTRGDGTEGEEITDNARTIRSLPLQLRSNPPQRLAVRGEVHIKRTEFTNLNERRVSAGQPAFANPRNAAAGVVRQLDSRAAARVPLDIICYDVLECDEPVPQTHTERLDALAALGFPTSDLNTPVHGFDDVEAYRKRLIDARDELELDLDGIVIKANDIAARERMGSRGRSPRWAFAWKFPPRHERTRVTRIVVQVGRTGKLTPVALLDPVDIGGVTVSRASLHNADEVKRVDVRHGDLVEIERAGDVIPHVAERIPEAGRRRAEPFAMPDECPVCSSLVVRDGAYHRCTNGLSCPAQLRGLLEHYGSREALDIDGLGAKTADTLVREGLVGELADLYRLSAEDLVDLEGFGRTSANQLVAAIDDSREPSLDRFLYGLGIPGVGRHVARQIASAFGELRRLMRADAETIRDVQDVGPGTSSAVVDFFASEQTRAAVEHVLNAGVRPRWAEPTGDQTLSGLTIVVTGSLERFTRDEIVQTIEERGGRVTSSISSTTDYLVVGERPGRKLDQAREHQVRTIDEAELRKLLETGPEDL